MKVDNWSLGCILYSFLVGDTPFDDKSKQQTFDKIKRMDYQIPDFVSEEARDLIAKFLHPDPSSRITLKDALCHPFLRELIPMAVGEISQDRQHLARKIPFNTERVKPFSHKKNDVNIEINDSGIVLLTFSNGERRFIVSKDGKTVWYEKQSGKRQEFHIDNLPSSVL